MWMMTISLILWSETLFLSLLLDLLSSLLILKTNAYLFFSSQPESDFHFTLPRIVNHALMSIIYSGPSPFNASLLKQKKRFAVERQILHSAGWYFKGTYSGNQDEGEFHVDVLFVYRGVGEGEAFIVNIWGKAFFFINLYIFPRGKRTINLL